MTFWDFCAPFYDIAEKSNGSPYGEMVRTVCGIVPQGAEVLEIAAGTGNISLAVAEKAGSVLCTDISERMLNIARKKAKKRKIDNIIFGNINIFDTGKPDNAFGAVIASQVLHLLDEPEKAAAELRRIAKEMVIMPFAFTKGLRGKQALTVQFYRLFGFAPKTELGEDEFDGFLSKIGFDNCEIIRLPAKITMAVAVWRK